MTVISENSGNEEPDSSGQPDVSAETPTTLATLGFEYDTSPEAAEMRKWDGIICGERPAEGSLPAISIRLWPIPIVIMRWSSNGSEQIKVEQWRVALRPVNPNGQTLMRGPCFMEKIVSNDQIVPCVEKFLNQMRGETPSAKNIAKLVEQCRAAYEYWKNPKKAIPRATFIRFARVRDTIYGEAKEERIFIGDCNKQVIDVWDKNQSDPNNATFNSDNEHPTMSVFPKEKGPDRLTHPLENKRLRIRRFRHGPKVDPIVIDDVLTNNLTIPQLRFVVSIIDHFVSWHEAFWEKYEKIQAEKQKALDSDTSKKIG